MAEADEDLFVSNEFVEDPVVSETPVYLSNQAGDRLVLLQYPTRKAPNHSKIKAMRLKPSQVLETDVESQMPSVFINNARSSSNSSNMGIDQSFSGVLNKSDGQFALAMVSKGSLHLTLIPRTGQQRPKFTPPAAVLPPSSMQAPTQQAKQADGAGLRSVQMSVKSLTTEQPKHTGVLEFWRQANKESSEGYEIGEIDESVRDAVLSAQNTSDIDLGLDIASEVSFL